MSPSLQKIRRGREFQSHSKETARYLNVGKPQKSQIIVWISEQVKNQKFLTPEDRSGHSFSHCRLTGFGTPRRSFSFDSPLKESTDEKNGNILGDFGKFAETGINIENVEVFA